MIDENLSRNSIKNLAEDDRPREKMMKRGESALTNAELLAILIGSGTPKQNAVELMQEIMEHCGGQLSRLSKLSIKELTKFNGIGLAKAITIKAAAEIGRRRAMEKAEDIKQIHNSSDIYEIMLPVLRDVGHEEFWVLMLNNNSRLLKKIRMSSGGLTQTSVDLRMVLKEAILAEATCLVVCHNHPSGTLRPSKDDIQLTERLKQASQTMNIRLIDHVIVTDGNYYSFADNGKI